MAGSEAKELVHTAAVDYAPLIVLLPMLAFPFILFFGKVFNGKDFWKNRLKEGGLIALPVCLDDIASTPAADLEPTVAAASSSSAAAGNPAESLARHRVRSDESELADSYQATVDEFAVQQLRVLPADHLSSHRDGGVAAKVTA